MKPFVMMKNKIMLGSAGLVCSQVLMAGGFSLYTEGNAALLGNFAAGSAAEAVDPSIGWYNPAGLALLQKDEVLVSGVGVFPVTKLSGLSQYNTVDFSPYIESFSALTSREQALVPAIHIAHPVGSRAVYGLSIMSPFGLSTQWPSTSPVRYSGTLTKLMTVNASPEFGAKITDHLTVGGGLDLQWADVTFNAIAGSPAALQYLQSLGIDVSPTFLDSSSVNKGDSFAMGFHAGVMGLFNQQHTRIGLNYQSRVSHQFQGKSTLKGRLAGETLTDPSAVYELDDLYSNYISLPDILTLSAYQDLSQRWAVLASVVWTGWQSFNTIRLNNIAGYSVDEGTQTPMSLTALESYRNAWRAALGFNYHVTDQWMMRVGAGYDETPTVNQERDVRLPDVNRWAYSIGAHYAVSQTLSFDVGYTYLMGSGQALIRKTQPIDAASSVMTYAHAVNHAQLAGLDVLWVFN